MELLADPLLVNACWICLLLGGVVLAFSVHDARFGETRGMRVVAIVLLALGAALGAADVWVALLPDPTVW
jgi:hypothetical protein